MWRDLRQGESRWTLFFILDANYSFDVSTQDDPTGFFPDNRLSGEVSQAVYNQFSIGEEYCQ